MRHEEFASSDVGDLDRQIREKKRLCALGPGCRSEGLIVDRSSGFFQHAAPARYSNSDGLEKKGLGAYPHLQFNKAFLPFAATAVLRSFIISNHLLPFRRERWVGARGHRLEKVTPNHQGSWLFDRWQKHEGAQRPRKPLTGRSVGSGAR